MLIDSRERIPELHVGRGIDYGALTIFPVWSDAPEGRRFFSFVDYVATELSPRPDLSTVRVTATGELCTLLLEGTILEGGWQDRVVTQSTLIAPGQSALVEVVGVEAGRWCGGPEFRAGRRRAPAAVRAAVYGLYPADGPTPDEIDQSDVWRRVLHYERTYGATGTSSLSEVCARAEVAVPRPLSYGEPTIVVDLPEPLFGQRGVIVMVDGEPLLLELFSDPQSLADQWWAILEASRVDAGTVPPAAAPGWWARDFASLVMGAPFDERRVGLWARMAVEGHHLFRARGVMIGGDLVHLTVINSHHEQALAG